VNSHFIRLKTEIQPAILEQLLRVMRFRGFTVEKMAVDTLTNEKQMQIDVSVKSPRPIHLLENQLMKLVDVKEVLVENSSRN